MQLVKIYRILLEGKSKPVATHSVRIKLIAMGNLAYHVRCIHNHNQQYRSCVRYRPARWNAAS